MEIVPTPNQGLTKQEAISYSKELIKMRKKHKRLNPDIVILESSKPDSILHSYFEWNNKKAANEYRKSQARQLLRSISVKEIVINEAGEKEEVINRLFITVSHEAYGSQGDYRPIYEIEHDKQFGAGIEMMLYNRILSTEKDFDDFKKMKEGKKIKKKFAEIKEIIKI